MKRWLRSLSFQELSPVSFTTTGGATSPTTPTAFKWRIQHLGAVGENDYIGSAARESKVTQVSIFDADKLTADAAEFGHGAGSTHLVSAGTPSSGRLHIDTSMDAVEKVSSLHCVKEHTNAVKDEYDVHRSNQLVSPVVRKKPCDSPEDVRSTQLSDKAQDLLSTIRSVNDRKFDLQRRIKNLTTINDDDERRLNQFIDVLRDTPLSPRSPRTLKQRGDDDDKAEETLTKLERLFVRSSDSKEKAERELAAVKASLDTLRDALKIEVTQSSMRTDIVSPLSKSGSPGAEKSDNHIQNLMRTLRNSETDVNGNDVEAPSRPSSTQATSTPRIYTSESHITDDTLASAYARLAKAQAHFDNLPRQYALDAQNYHETYQSCLKTVTDFDLEHLVQSQIATRDLIEAEKYLAEVKRHAHEEQVRTTKRYQIDEHFPSDQTSNFLSHPDDVHILDRELQDAINTVDRVRIERWRRHIVQEPSSQDGTITLQSTPQQTSDIENHAIRQRPEIDQSFHYLPSLSCGQSICGFASSRSRDRIDRWNAYLARHPPAFSPSRESQNVGVKAKANPDYIHPRSPTEFQERRTQPPSSRKPSVAWALLDPPEFDDRVKNTDAYRRNGSFSGPVTGAQVAEQRAFSFEEEAHGYHNAEILNAPEAVGVPGLSRTESRSQGTGFAILHVDEYEPGSTQIPATAHVREPATNFREQVDIWRSRSQRHGEVHAVGHHSDSDLGPKGEERPVWWSEAPGPAEAGISDPPGDAARPRPTTVEAVSKLSRGRNDGGRKLPEWI